MLQTRHRPDKENQVFWAPKTPAVGKSTSSKNPLKTPFKDENLLGHNGNRTVKKVGGFDQQDPSKFNSFQTPG